jgi:N-acyl-phosphatidylethanolamine-hydrolysing phospholipase D
METMISITWGNLKSSMFLQIGIILGLLLVVICFPQPVSAQDKPNHHTSDGFRNYPPVPAPPSLSIGFYLRRIWSAFNLPDVPEKHYLPEENAIQQLQEFTGKNTLTWIGQSTFLIRIDGRTILTDPFFSKYAGPFSIGPKRYVKPGIGIRHLPPIDIIIVSHNHYDHLDAGAIKALPNKNNIHVFVPLGIKNFFTERGYTHVHELDWNDNFAIHDIKMFCLPSVHYSGRGLTDKNKTLWCSWAICSPSGRYYFVGDTAYSSTIFKKIGNKFKSFDLAMVTIGTYGNRKYGVNNHTTPEEAVNLGMDINSNIFVGMHWGTIEQSDEPPWEPPKRFSEAALKAGISEKRIWIMKIGETRILPLTHYRK